MNTSSNGFSTTGKIYGDGVNDIQASMIDGNLNLTTGNGFIKADINVGGKELKNLTFNGNFILGRYLEMSLSKGYTVSFDIEDDHVVISSVDDNTGKILFGANGMNLIPNGTGSLNVAITEDGKTTNTIISVTGSVNYSPADDGAMILGDNTTLTVAVEGMQELSITSQTANTASFSITDEGFKITSTDPETFAGTILGGIGGAQLTNAKLKGSAEFSGSNILISDGSTLDATISILEKSYSRQMKFAASGGSDTIISFADVEKYLKVTTSAHFEGTSTSFDHGSVGYTTESCYLSAGTAFTKRDTTRSIILEDVGNYTVNGTTITNGVAGSTITSDLSENITYNGTTYAAGTFAIDANGQASGTVINSLNSLMSYNDYVAESTLFSVPAINDTTNEDATLTDLVYDTKAVTNLTSTLDDATNEFTLKPAQTYLIRYNRSDD